MATTVAHQHFSDIPLIALGVGTRQILAKLLNPNKILLTDDGYWRDWRGIAHLSQLYSLYGSTISRESNPIAKVLDLWCNHKTETATFGLLIQFLQNIDRWDVCDDIENSLAEDAKAFEKRFHQKASRASSKSENSQSNSICKTNDIELLTKDDVWRAEQGLPLQQYDAFLLYADEDTNYAHEMLSRLENTNSHNSFKLCVKDRDLLAGISFEHEAITKLIEERCHRVIVILTSAFLHSPANSFFVNYTQALQIQQRKRKIIPCLYEKTMNIPRTLKIYFLLKYIPNSIETTKPLYDFWEKLSISIRSVPATTEISLSVTQAMAYNSSNLLDNKNHVLHTTKRSLAIPDSSVSTICEGLQTENANKQQSFSDVPTKIPRNKFNKTNTIETNNSDDPKGHDASNNPDDSTKTNITELSALPNAPSKKGKKWLKTWRKNTNTWLKKRLSSS